MTLQLLGKTLKIIKVEIGGQEVLDPRIRNKILKAQGLSVLQEPWAEAMRI